MSFQFGVNLMVWSGQIGAAELALLPAIKEMGYDGVELPIFDPDAVDVDAIRRALSTHQLGCTVSTALPAGLSLIDEPVRDESVHWLQRIVQIAADLGAPTVCGPLAVPVGEMRGRGYIQAEWDSCVQALRAVGQTAETLGVVLALEPLNRFETFFVNTVADGVRLMDDIDHPAVGLLLDTFHMHIEERSTPDAILAGARHIKHFHTSENDRGPVGAGQVPWDAVFAALQETDYRGWLVVESFNAVIPELAGATCIWRPLADGPDALAAESIAFLSSHF